jgi:hypothetical protein
MHQNVTDMNIWLTHIIPYVTTEYKYLFLGSDMEKKKKGFCVCVFNYMEQSASWESAQEISWPLKVLKSSFLHSQELPTSSFPDPSETISQVSCFFNLLKPSCYQTYHLP